MNDAEYVVPPSAPTPGSSNNPNNAPKSPKKPSKVLAWVKANTAVTVAGSVMAVVVILFGAAMITGQKLDFFGLQLNPLYQRASCDNLVDGCVQDPSFVSGEFANGTVNQLYTQSFSVNPQTFTADGTITGICSWSVLDTNPKAGFPMEFITTQGGPGTTATFRATPTAAGTYNVTIRVTCGATGQVITVTKPWVVTGATTDLSVTANFSENRLGEVYHADLSTVNANGATCTYNLGNVNPEIPNISLNGAYWPEPKIPGETENTLVMTPQNPGTYKITVGVTCTPKSGGAAQTTQKTFDFIVPELTGVVGVSGTGIDLNASFADGTVNTPYTTIVNSTGANGNPYFCRATVKSITPSMAGAYINSAYGAGHELAGTFIVTPKTAGNYTVKVRAICGYNDGSNSDKPIVFEKDFPWKVNASGGGTPTPTEGLDIAATFANSTVGTAFSTNVELVTSANVGVYTCSLSLLSVSPNISGATLTPNVNVTKGNPPQSTFNATPTNGGTYTVKIGALCDPTNPLMGIKSLSKEKDFTWTVSANQNDPTPPAGQLSLSATFANGKVGQAYSTAVSTVNGGATCTIALVSMSPAMSGATVETVGITNGIPGSKLVNFKATPTTAGTYAVKLSATCPPSVGNGPTTYAEKTFNWVVDAAATGGTGGGTGGSGSGSGSGGSGSGGSGSSGGSGGGSTTANVCSTYSNKLIPIYRWWNDSIKDHFYTINANEKPSGYISEGISGYIFSEKIPGSTALYRSFSAPLTAHYYSTTDDAEKYGYKTEGIMGYVFSSSTSGTVPWYRLHKGWPANDYLETISTKEKSEAMSNLAYSDAGIAAYLCGSKQ